MLKKSKKIVDGMRSVGIPQKIRNIRKVSEIPLDASPYIAEQRIEKNKKYISVFFLRGKALHNQFRKSLGFLKRHSRIRVLGLIMCAGLVAFFGVYHFASQRMARYLGSSPRDVLGSAWIAPSFNPHAFDPVTYQIPDAIHPRGFNIVFVSDDFQTFDEFKQSVANIMGTMKKTEPWKNYDGFNLFLIFNRDNTMCQVDRKNEYAPLLKCSKALIPLVQTLPLVKVKIVVVSRKNFISWANLTRFENSFVFYSVPKEKENDAFNKKVILVEIAHGFGLRDETRSVNAVSGEAPGRPSPPNCAPTLDVARAWWGDLVKRTGNNILTFSRVNNDVGFYFGCAGNDSYIRPTQQSLMNIQDFPGAENYGPVSERYLKKVLDYCFSDTRYRIADDPAFFDLYPELKECAGG